jgi:hydroxypyruvate isomerase
MLSACIEMLFKAEHVAMVDRIRAAHMAGIEYIEFWGWRDKDIDGLEHVLQATGVGLTCFLLDPRAAIVDPATHEGFLQALRETASVANRLGAAGVIVLTGDARADVPRAAQHAAVVAALKAAAPIAAGAGLTLLLEPLNTKVDHVGYFLDTTVEGLDIVEEVGSPAVRLLYDLYHSAMMQEVTADVLVGRGHLIGHVHIADAPGRHEPGSGAIDWTARLREVREAGYAGAIGLEYRPTTRTEDTLNAARRHLAQSPALSPPYRS